MKRNLLRFATNISVSDAVRNSLPTASTVINNPFEEDRFRVLPGIERTVDLAFVGRLVSEKGIDLLLSTIAMLAKDGITAHLTIIGSGPEEGNLRQLSQELGVSPQITFAGIKRGNDLVEELNRHRILVIPSRCQETFGLVALEGIACGCVVAGSSGGGLPDAIGPCGLVIPNMDSSALAKALGLLLSDADARETLRAPAADHLARHRPSEIAARYVKVFEQALK